jgi:3-oxoadipate enol-lactonase
MPYAVVNGLRLHYLDEGEGFPLVLLHGFTTDSEFWREQISSFSPRCRVIAPDMRSHGKSEKPETKCTLEDLSDDLRGLLEDLEIDQAVLCGLSLGGMIAQIFAIEHPEMVRALVLCDTMSSAQNPVSQEIFDGWAKALSSGNLEGFFDTMPQFLFDQEFISSPRGSRFISDWRRRFLKLDGKALSQIALAMKGLDEGLEEISAPTLIIVGSDDLLTPPVLSRRMHKLIPNSKILEIEGATHISNLTRGGEFNRALADFLDAFNP